jgi:hypothetical protein
VASNPIDDDDNPIEELLLSGFPNPERRGCPPPAIIEALGEGRIGREHEAWGHIWNCSPCFGDFKRIRNARWARENQEEQKKRGSAVRKWFGFASLVACFAVLLVLFWTKRLPRTFEGLSVALKNASPATRRVLPSVAFVSYDARSLSGDRGVHSHATVSPIEFVRTSSMHLSITLPVGMESGTYDIRLRYGNDPNPIYSSTGTAVLDATSRNNVLSAIVPTDQLPSGQYQLDFRQTGNVQWWPLTAVLR